MQPASVARSGRRQAAVCQHHARRQPSNSRTPCRRAFDLKPARRRLASQSGRSDRISSKAGRIPVFRRLRDSIVWACSAQMWSVTTPSPCVWPDPYRALLDPARELSSGLDGVLIQRRLEPAAPIAAAFGDKPRSVRMLVFLTSTGAILHRATAKIPTGDNVADSYWRSGNVLGSLHPETGQLEPAVTGSAHNLRSVEIHPDTHARLIGTIVPDWPELVDLVLRAATLLPELAHTITGYRDFRRWAGHPRSQFRWRFKPDTIAERSRYAGCSLRTASRKAWLQADPGVSDAEIFVHDPVRRLVNIRRCGGNPVQLRFARAPADLLGELHRDRDRHRNDSPVEALTEPDAWNDWRRARGRRTRRNDRPPNSRSSQ